MTCTCNFKPWPDGPDWNPHCPKHGLDALLAQADPKLDIDEAPEPRGGPA